MGRRHTKESFIAKARMIHGDLYDYSEVKYRNNATKIRIRCIKHNLIFMQRPVDHLNGCGCPICWKERRKKGAVGVGIMDIDNESHSICAKIWRNMITRCYKTSELKKHPTYIDCRVCDEWLIFSNFKAWFENPANGYKDGYDLDKDILGIGQKLYSPETCCFIPQEINKLIITKNKKRSNLPLGVRKLRYGYQAFVSVNGHPTYIGHCSTAHDAHVLYLNAKSKHIQDCATDYYNSGKITERVYNGLFRLSQSLTDRINRQ